MEPDTHNKCRVFGTGKQGKEGVFKAWGRRLRFHFKQQYDGTSSYYLWFLVTQTTSAGEVLEVWVATEQFKEDSSYRVAGIR